MKKHDSFGRTCVILQRDWVAYPALPNMPRATPRSETSRDIGPEGARGPQGMGDEGIRGLGGRDGREGRLGATGPAGAPGQLFIQCISFTSSRPLSPLTTRPSYYLATWKPSLVTQPHSIFDSNKLYIYTSLGRGCVAEWFAHWQRRMLCRKALLLDAHPSDTTE